VLAEIAEHAGWVTHPAETLGVARGLYLRLPVGARLWLRRAEFCPADLQEIRHGLS